MDAALQEVHAPAGDADRVGAAITAASICPKSGRWSASGLRAALGGHAIAALGQRIDDGHQFDVVAGRQLLGVEAAQSSRADDRDSQAFHAWLP